MSELDNDEVNGEATSTLVFNVPSDDEKIEIPIVLNGKGLTGRKFVLVEASGPASLKYKNACAKCSAFQDGEFVGIQGDIASTQPLLISLCLFEDVPDGRRVPTSFNFAANLPSKVQRTLFDKAKEISELGDEEETAEELEKQIEKLQKKLTKLYRNESEAGNEQSS